MKIAKKQIYKKCFVVLICFFIAGNSTYVAVLCFGSDGQIEIESVFHERCDDPACSQHRDQKQLSYQSDPIKDKNCEPCVDLPVSISLAKISRVSKQLNSTFSAPATNAVVLVNKSNLSAYNSASNTFDATSYFTSLRTVILIV